MVAAQLPVVMGHTDLGLCTEQSECECWQNYASFELAKIDQYSLPSFFFFLSFLYLFSLIGTSFKD